MSKKIHYLSNDCIDQIAAGEVIERPASVVKELVENALDADSTRIEIFLTSGGKEKIQVNDDGTGIASDDIELAVMRHATSKISSARDLFGVQTHGFRGEALASITSVAQVTITSRVEDEETATELRIEPGASAEIAKAARERGTTITVENLFCNTPVRAKFLHSDSTECSKVLDIVERIALANPQIAFRLLNDDKELLSVRPGTLESRMQEILDPKFSPQMHPVQWEQEGISITGFIGDEKTHRLRRQHQYLFLGRRPIWNATLLKAISQGTEALHAHPAALLFISLPPEEVDVNVHPAKREVRFADESLLFTSVVRALREALAARSGWEPGSFETPSDQIPLSSSLSTPPTSSASWKGFSWSVNERPLDSSQHADLFANDPTVDRIVRWTTPVSDEDSLSNEAHRFLLERAIFQVGMSYIATESSDGLLLIHQSTAHQRVLFDRARQRLSQKEITTQRLLFPELLEFSPSQALWLERNEELLRRLGFDLEPFGTRAWQLRGIPNESHPSEAVEALKKMAEDGDDSRPASSDAVEALTLSFAKRSAIPTLHPLSRIEMINLVDDLFASSNPYVAPDGSSIVLKLSLDNIEESFKKGRLF